MKRFINLFLLLFFISTSISASLEPLNDNEYVYTIHIGAFVKARLSDFEAIQTYGFVYAEQFDPSLLRIYMGDYDKESEAKTVIKKVRESGYSEAYITGRSLAKGKEVAVIQLASKKVGENINWSDYSAAGMLHVILNQGDVKIVMGSFASAEEARQRLGAMRKLGFKDAFVKTINNVYLHKISSFEAGDDFRPNSNLSVEMTSEKTSTSPTTENKNIPVPEDVPQSYDILAYKTPEASYSLPGIRTNVKRNSVYELQTDLKALKFYNSSLDGLYGKGSESGYAQALEQLPQLRKYQILSEQLQPLSYGKQENILQHYLNTLLTNTQTAVTGLAASKEPVAKAYRAYLLFRTQGDQAEIDNLMNSAIKEAFSKNNTLFIPNFDSKATYKYTSLDQLLLHLRYVQAASANNLAVPCWMFQQHPKEAQKAFTSGAASLKMEGCEQLSEWPEVKLLVTIANDIAPSAPMTSNQSSRRAMLALSPVKPDASQIKSFEAWHDALMKGLEEWAEKEPLHDRLVTALRIAYFQSFVRLEDYFMDKEFNPKESRTLALAVLQTLVDEQLSAYAVK